MAALVAALAIAGRIAFMAFPNVKPTTDIVIFTGFALGALAAQGLWAEPLSRKDLGGDRATDQLADPPHDLAGIAISLASSEGFVVAPEERPKRRSLRPRQRLRRR